MRRRARRMIATCGPARTQMIEGWRRQLRALGIQAPLHGQDPDPDDLGLTVRDTGWGGTAACVIVDGHAVQPLDLTQLVAAAASRAASPRRHIPEPARRRSTARRSRGGSGRVVRHPLTGTERLAGSQSPRRCPARRQ